MVILAVSLIKSKLINTYIVKNNLIDPLELMAIMIVW